MHARMVPRLGDRDNVVITGVHGIGRSNSSRLQVRAKKTTFVGNSGCTTKHPWIGLAMNFMRVGGGWA